MSLRVPRWAELAIRLASGREAEWVLAELEAELEKHTLRVGGRAAGRWLVLEVLRSVRPLVFARIRSTRVSNRTMGGATMLEVIRQDVRYAARALRRSPGFTVTAVLTVALGIGAATTMFGVFEAVLLRALPFDDPDRLAAVESYRPATGESWSIAYGDFRDWHEAEVFEGVAVYARMTGDLIGAGEPTQITAALVGPEFFDVLGTRARLGRLLRPDDWTSGERPAVISHALWQSSFGGAPDVVGRTLRIGETPVTVVGVLEPRAGFPSSADLWGPLIESDYDEAVLSRRDNFMFLAVARLRADRTPEQTSAQLGMLADRVMQETSRRDGVSVRAVPIRSWILGDVVPLAFALMLAAVCVVMVIGCANVAGLMMARSSSRRREFSVRTALGSGRGRVVRQVLTESALIAGAGCLLGILFAHWGVQLVVAFAPADLYGLDAAGVNMTVLLGAIGAAAACALLFGTVPALQAARVAPAGVLAETGQRTGMSRARQRSQRILVGGQIALCIVLLSGAGLLAGSLRKLLEGDPGVRVDSLLTVPLAVPAARYPEPEDRLAFYGEVLREVERLPGARSATLTSYVPLGGSAGGLVRAYLAEHRPEPPAGVEVVGPWTVAAPAHFETFGTALLEGREFDDRDAREATPVMIVNRRFAELMFPGEEAIGKRVRSWRDENVLREIVGVVENVRYFGATDEIRPLVYVPFAQTPWTRMTLVVRTDVEPARLAPAIRELIRVQDPDLAVSGIRTMTEVRNAALAGTRFTAALFGTFAGLALVLATVGLYGLLAYGVAQRDREIGVRMALGARRAQVLRLVLGQSLGVVLPAVLIGLAGAAATTRLMRGMLFEMDPLDPGNLVGVATFLIVVALLASAIPAARATRIDPARSLRNG